MVHHLSLEVLSLLAQRGHVLLKFFRFHVHLHLVLVYQGLLNFKCPSIGLLHLKGILSQPILIVVQCLSSHSQILLELLIFLDKLLDSLFILRNFHVTLAELM